MSQQTKATVLCVDTTARGKQFITEAAAQGCDVLLITLDSLQNADWPRTSISQFVALPAGFSSDEICNRVSYLARHHRIDRVVALGQQDMETAAILREHLRLPGMGQSTTRIFSDRLAMRMRAQRVGIPTREFLHVLHYDSLRAFMDQVPSPWRLVPRSTASLEEPQRIDTSQQLWRVLDDLGDTQSDYLLERAPEGKTYLVDSVSWDKEVLLARALRYGSTGDLKFMQSVRADDIYARPLLGLHSQLLESLGMADGVAHAIYRQMPGNNQYLFEEARFGVGSEPSIDVVAASIGINLWVEWANIEAASALQEEYVLPRTYQEWAAGCVIGQGVDLDAPEVLKKNDFGVILRAASAERIDDLLHQVRKRD